MNKKVVVLGGGRSLSILMRGLKLFPIDLSAVVAVSDDGSSTGRLREEFSTPAVGDVRGVLVSMAETEDIIKELLQYRFNTTSDLNGHTVGNLILTAMTKITGNLSDAIEQLGNIFKIKGTILPFTEEKVTLIAEMSDGTTIEGEHNITEAHKKIENIYYKEDPIVTPKVIKAVEEADLIIFGIGSLYTSIIPNILSDEMRKAITNSKAKKMYICNAMTQSGETDKFKVSDCIKTLNKYMKQDFLDIVIAANTKIPDEIIEKYKTIEAKSTILIDPTEIDEERVKDLNVELLQEDLLVISEQGFVEHDSLKTALLIFNYIMKNSWKREKLAPITSHSLFFYVIIT